MSNRAFTESTVEQAALAWLESVGWRVLHGPEIAPGEPAAERDDYGQVILPQRLRDALLPQPHLRRAAGRRELEMLTEPVDLEQWRLPVSRACWIQPRKSERREEL